jgi:hypothetical protein
MIFPRCPASTAYLGSDVRRGNFDRSAGGGFGLLGRFRWFGFGRRGGQISYRWRGLRDDRGCGER